MKNPPAPAGCLNYALRSYHPDVLPITERDSLLESILMGDAGSPAAFVDSCRGHRVNVGANARAGMEPQSVAFGLGSVAVSEDRATRRTDEKGAGGPKERKF
jgi:hypothetical protein